MREADRRTIEDIGIPSLVLMENAGRQVVAAMEAIHTDILDRQVAILCGRGNNGGDGFVVARTLLQRGVDVFVFLIGQVADVLGLGGSRHAAPFTVVPDCALTWSSIACFQVSRRGSTSSRQAASRSGWVGSRHATSSLTIQR